MNAHNLAPKYLTSFIDSLPETSGTIDLEFKGSGTPSEQFDGVTVIKTDRLAIKPTGLGPLNILHAAIQAQVLLNKKQISWQNLILKVGESEVKSEGKIEQWLSDLPTYEAKIDSDIEEIEQVLKNIDAEWITSRIGSLPKDFAFSGKFDLSGSIFGKYPNQHFTSQVGLHNASIKLKKRNFILSAINGSIKSDQNGLHVQQVKGTLNKGTLEAFARISTQRK